MFHDQDGSDHGTLKEPNDSFLRVDPVVHLMHHGRASDLDLARLAQRTILSVESHSLHGGVSGIKP